MIQDERRLRSLLKDVFELMKDGEWRTLGEIRDAVERGTETSISARLRDLRKSEFGGYDIQKREVRSGLWQYRLLVPDCAPLLS